MNKSAITEYYASGQESPGEAGRWHLEPFQGVRLGSALSLPILDRQTGFPEGSLPHFPRPPVAISTSIGCLQRGP